MVEEREVEEVVRVQFSGMLEVRQGFVGVSVPKSFAAGLDFPSDLKGDTAGEENRKEEERERIEIRNI